MIQKKKLPYINKLHIVQLYEADFNTILKTLLGRQLMRHGEAHGLNGHQLYRSRKGKSTYDALITFRIIYDMALVQRDYVVSMFNDLMGYYYRVRPALNTVTTRGTGVSKNVAVCMTTTLRRMKHHIRNGFGISTDTLQWDIHNNNGGLG